MARIKGFEYRETSSRPHPTNIVCYYQVVQTPATTYVQLTTHGAPETRQTRPKNSQTMQFDKERARELVTILRQAFGDDL